MSLYQLSGKRFISIVVLHYIVLHIILNNHSNIYRKKLPTLFEIVFKYFEDLITLVTMATVASQWLSRRRGPEIIFVATAQHWMLTMCVIRGLLDRNI